MEVRDHGAHVEVRDHFQELVLAFQHVGPGHLTPAVKFGGIYTLEAISQSQSEIRILVSTTNPAFWGLVC